VQNLLKTRPKNFFSDGIKKNCETLELVRWSREGLLWKVILVSSLYICNGCAFLLKSLFTFWLTLVFIFCTEINNQPQYVFIFQRHFPFLFFHAKTEIHTIEINFNYYTYYYSRFRYTTQKFPIIMYDSCFFLVQRSLWNALVYRQWILLFNCCH
jgi:hypothetical protein